MKKIAICFIFMLVLFEATGCGKQAKDFTGMWRGQYSEDNGCTEVTTLMLYADGTGTLMQMDETAGKVLLWRLVYWEYDKKEEIINLSYSYNIKKDYFTSEQQEEKIETITVRYDKDFDRLTWHLKDSKKRFKMSRQPDPFKYGMNKKLFKRDE